MKRPEWFAPIRGFGDWIGVLGGILVGSAIIALVTWNVVRLAEGKVTAAELACVDQTDPCNWSAYRVRNDTGRAVVVRQCARRCAHGDSLGDPISIAPGRVTRNDVYEVSATVGERDWWEVRSSSGRQLGCLVLDGHRHKRDGDLVVVSQARPCLIGT